MKGFKFRFSIFLLILFLVNSGLFTVASETESVIDNPDVKVAIDVFDAWLQHRVYKQEIPGTTETINTFVLSIGCSGFYRDDFVGICAELRAKKDYESVGRRFESCWANHF